MTRTALCPRLLQFIFGGARPTCSTPLTVQSSIRALRMSSAPIPIFNSSLRLRIVRYLPLGHCPSSRKTVHLRVFSFLERFLFPSLREGVWSDHASLDDACRTV